MAQQNKKRNSDGELSHLPSANSSSTLRNHLKILLLIVAELTMSFWVLSGKGKKIAEFHLKVLNHGAREKSELLYESMRNELNIFSLWEEKHERKKENARESIAGEEGFRERKRWENSSIVDEGAHETFWYFSLPILFHCEFIRFIRQSSKVCQTVPFSTRPTPQLPQWWLLRGFCRNSREQSIWRHML